VLMEPSTFRFCVFYHLVLFNDFVQKLWWQDVDYCGDGRAELHDCTCP